MQVICSELSGRLKRKFILGHCRIPSLRLTILVTALKNLVSTQDHQLNLLKLKPNHHMKTKLLAILSTILSSALLSHALPTPMGSPIYNPATGHNYQLLTSASWPESETVAQSLGGHLVTINDATENLWVFNTFMGLTGSATPSLWIGLTDQANEGNFVWASGEPVTFTNWYPGEPNNTPNADPTGEDYASLRGPQNADPHPTWNDLPTAGGGAIGTIFGVVEVPEPTTATLLALGLLTATRKHFVRRK